jgi:hypothetical protein
MTTTRPSFYAATTTLDPEERYWRFLFDGTNFEAIELGELVLGQSRTLTRPSFQPGSTQQFMQPRIMNTSLSGQNHVSNLSDDQNRALELDFIFLTEAQKDEMRDQVLVRSGYGKDPLIIVPDSNDTKTVIYGRYHEESWEYQRNIGGTETLGIYRCHLSVIEDPFSIGVS